jgi:hypothetical protein
VLLESLALAMLLAPRTAAKFKINRRKKKRKIKPPSCNKTACPTECNYSTGWRFYPGGLKIKPPNCFIPAAYFKFGCSALHG